MSIPQTMVDRFLTEDLGPARHMADSICFDHEEGTFSGVSDLPSVWLATCLIDSNPHMKKLKFHQKSAE